MDAPVDPSQAHVDVLDQDSQMAAALQHVDWQATELGPVAHWPQSLRAALSICLGSSFQIAIYWGPQLNLLYNDAWSPILGSKHPWALGRPASVVWPEIWDTIGPLFDSVVRTGRATRSTDQLLAMHRHGFTEECYFDYTFSPIRAEGGRVGGIFNAVVETTFRVLGERGGRLLRDLGERLYAASSVEEVGRAAAEVLGAATHDLPWSALYLAEDTAAGQPASFRRVGEVAADLPPAAAPATLAADDAVWPVGRLLQSGSAQPVDGLAERFGAPLPGGPWPEPSDQALLLPLAGPDAARPLGLLVAGISPRLSLDERYRDLIERVAGLIAAAVGRARAAEQERERAAALAELNRAKTTFFSNVSHELRTPLTLILGPLEALLNGAALRAQPAERESVAVALRNAQRLLRLVNTLLDFSRIEAGRMQARFEPTPLPAYTRELADVFRSAIESAGLRFDVRCDDAAFDEPVWIDREMWEKIVLNLLSNALKFTLRGHVALSLRCESGCAVLSVADSGIGIAADELPRLFERFHRVPQAGGRTHEGTGIGLALVRELAGLHGGHAEAHSSPGVGSTFTVTVPLGHGHLPAGQLVTAPAAAAPPPAASQAGQWLAGEAAPWAEETGWPADTLAPLEAPASPTAPAAVEGSVLVVDDNADMRDYLRRLLSPRFELRVARDGEEALRLVRESPPDLILSDVMMPRLDGLGLLRAVREDPALKAVPVILLSARVGEEARLEALDALADDYLSKPFSARELLARVSAQVGTAQIRREALARWQQANRLLAQQTERLSRLFEAAPGFMAVLRGPEHVIEMINTAYQQHVGVRSVLGRRLIDALPELRGQPFLDLLDEVYRSGRPYVGEAMRVLLQRAPSAALEERFVDFVYQPFELTQGGLPGIFVQGYDVTDRKRAEDALRDADRRKDEFLATLAHELRNPLAPIRQAAAVFGAAHATPAQKLWCQQVIQRQVSHMALLLDDLLDVSRITRGQLTLRKERIALADVVAAAVETASPLIESRHHELIVDLPESIELDADPLRLAQVFGNLLTNAAKYTDPGGVIRLRAAREGGMLTVAVADNGIGIPAEKLAQVFEMFSQEKAAIERSEGGLGIGLALVKGLVELHGGSVGARSGGLGQGSEFLLRLPLAPAPAASDAEQAAALAPPATPAAGRRILVVDDNADAAESLALNFSLQGHEAVVATSPLQALELVARFQPDVAVLDIGLPGMNGYELARRLRALPQGARLRLIAVTGWGQDEDKAQARAAGFDAHLTKPVDLARLNGLLRAGPEAR